MADNVPRALEQISLDELALDDELELLRIIVRKFRHLDADARERVLAYAGDVHKSITQRDHREVCCGAD
jgi:hypothetical protein